ncbi:hypothetical protein BCR34DRAFT_474598 [Clohesyomyces aquaticus]|uniref:25S rRNA (uridine-N(3))-methyltransferase BMT5-like domain-containing protein n=1 Tax=Clohesyomyces aquaticus TaxID=1231657 RepID=A0A1Y2A508_9PLEO|nr:hypothetical protein BCR34DRAFT_474598 [Clohesyomyces aquaticus]
MSKTRTKKVLREAKRESRRKAANPKSKKTAGIAKPTGVQKKPQNAGPKKQAKSQMPPTAESMNKTKTKAPIQASQKPAVPFGEYDNILLVGEGDFSFARSLVVEHGCANVIATSLDSEEDVLAKYPTTFPPTHSTLTSLAPPVPLHHNIDATKLHTYKPLKAAAPYDTIAFLFPHTGGLSRDVNRQVRANQALLVPFFESCVESEKRRRAVRERKKQARRNAWKDKEFLKTGGKVIVTLFEGDPYTLWNVRDLARHTGLRVLESFKFDWAAYPRYHHVRTLGEIEGGGAWKGEEREARMFVFEKVEVKDEDDEEEDEGKVEGEAEGRWRKKKDLKLKMKKRAREESGSEDD